MRNLFFAAALALASLNTQAHDPLTYDRVSFAVTERIKVEPDQFSATLYAEESGREPAKLAREVSKHVRWAIKQVQGRKGVEVETGSYRSYPVYSKVGNVSSWRVRQEMRVTTNNADVLSQLIGGLQERMRISAVRHQLSTERSREVEEKLSSVAIGRFRARAEQLARDLGGRGHRLVELRVQGGGQQPGRALAYRAASSSARTPAILPGRILVTISVQGTIELGAVDPRGLR